MKQKDALYILIPAFIMVLVWIGFNIHHNAITSTIPQATNIQIEPIAPRFDTQTIEKLKKRDETIAVFEINQNTATESSSIATQSASKK